MITDCLLYFVSVFLHIASLTGGSLFRLNRDRQELYTNKFLKFKVWLVYIYWVKYLVFLAVQAIRFQLIQDFNSFNIVFAYFVAFLPPFPLVTVLLFKTESFVSIINTSFETFANLTSK
ncbi:unnamed protein product [Orchesella dallaii]|uniref:Uncharacterized protein n=1 Tax=Orchesella dallaii TaxID=48710 RepID=A0ABP1QA95_9HEXA